jgi:hypothetical protein
LDTNLNILLKIKKKRKRGSILSLQLDRTFRVIYSFSAYGIERGRMSAEAEAEAEAEYFSKDFEWETLRQEIEDNPSYQYHLLPFTCTPPSQQQEIQVSEDSKAWKRFHLRHSSGKFFKVFTYYLIFFQLSLDSFS